MSSKKSSKTSKLLPVKTPPKTKCSGCPLVMDEIDFDRGLWCSGDCGGFWCEDCWSGKELLTFPYDDQEEAYCAGCNPLLHKNDQKSKPKKSALTTKERTCSSCKHVMSAAEYEKGEWCSGDCEGYFCQKCLHDDKCVTVLDRGDAYCAGCCPTPPKNNCGGCRLSVNKKENAKAFKQMKLCDGGCGKYFCKECCKDFGANGRCKGCTEALNPKVSSAAVPPKVDFDSYDLLLAQQAQLAHELLELRKRVVADPRYPFSKNDEKVTVMLKRLEDDMKPVRAFLKLEK